MEFRVAVEAKEVYPREAGRCSVSSNGKPHIDWVTCFRVRAKREFVGAANYRWTRPRRARYKKCSARHSTS